MELELRPMCLDDVDVVCAVQNAAYAHDGLARVVEPHELAEELAGIDLLSDSRVALVDGVVAGYCATHHMPSEVRLERCYVVGVVAPSHRGCGVGTALLSWALGRAGEQLRSTGSSLRRFVRIEAYEQVADAQRLFEGLGFAPVRWFDELVRPLGDLPEAIAPPGVRIERWPDDRDDEIRRVKDAAFADHWGSTPTDPEDWQRAVRGFGARPDLGGIAVDERTGDVVGLCLVARYAADDEVLGRSEAWIDTLATLDGWRGRGVASALVTAALHACAAEGLTHAAIGVDADSITGANRLYRSLGFTVERRSVTYELEVT